MTIAGDLAKFIVQSGYDDLPPLAVDYAAMLISSTIASASLGSTLGSSKIIRDLELQRGGTPEATVWFFKGPKLPVAAAARINAVMSDAAASDDSDLRNIVHPGTTLAASSLAVAEKTGAKGKEILAAIVLGYEAAGRINGAVIPGLREKGFHGCVIAIFGGAVAAGHLMQLSHVQMTHAIALAATSIGGIMASARTSTAREYHAGLAAMLGVNAAQAAALGYTGEESILETKNGFFTVFGEKSRLTSVTSGFGKQWEILNELAIKLVPGGHPYHALAEAAANAAREGNISPGEIKAIVMSQPDVHELIGPRHPTDLIGIAHSPAYFLAAGAADRDFSWHHASEEKIHDPVIRSLLDKVEVAKPEFENPERYKCGARVTIHTIYGQSYSSTVFAPKGSAARDVKWLDVECKYRALTPFAGLSPECIDTSVKMLKEFRDASASELVSLLQKR